MTQSKKFFLITLIFLIVTTFSNAEIIKPNPKLTPLEVLKIQLNSLKNNDVPYPDAGIIQTWEFAHPNNKRATGPLSKFKKMIHSESYNILLNHLSHKVEILLESDAKHIFGVNILANDKRFFYYEWQVSKTISNNSNLNGCWLTNAVSMPELLGDEI